MRGSSKRRETKKMSLKENAREILIVVLDGMRVLTEGNGLSPLRCALREVVRPENEVVVLTIFNSQEQSQSQSQMLSPVIKGCCLPDGKNYQYTERDKYIKYLREEISLKTEAYMKIFRPFYERCKSSGVKLLVNIVAGSEPEDIIVDEVDNARACWVVLERSFAMDNCVKLKGKACKLSLVGDDDDIVMHTYAPLNGGFGSSGVGEIKFNPKCSKHKTKSHHRDEPRIYCTLPNFDGIYQSSSSSSFITNTSGDGDIPASIKSLEVSTDLRKLKGALEEIESSVVDEKKVIISPESYEVDHVFPVLGMPLRLSWEAISEITYSFNRMVCADSNEGFQMYRGFMFDCQSHIFVKRYTGGDFSNILEGEKQAALTMYHKNIMRLVGYHQNENAVALVFPYTSRGTSMDRFLCGSDYFKKELHASFHTKIMIAIGIAQGLRYMHEECPRGPIVHCDLRPCNILLRYDLQPMITSFGRAKWLQLEEVLDVSNRCGHKHPSEPESLALLKADILDFGILLLRLFCRKSAPRDSKKLVEWARPLLARRAYHELYDEDMEYDAYGIFRVTCVASHCINTKQNSRPCMSEVVAFLKGEISCAVPLSPLSDGSPNIELHRLLGQ